MTIHRQVFKPILLLIVSLALMSFKTADEQAVEALARRVMGSKAKAVVFEQIESSTDSYELLQKGKKVLIRGNNANSMAVGLNRYIQQYCLANVSWYDFNPVELPKKMPQVPEKVSGKVEVPIRFFLNYCTFGYTMPWWKWQQWERCTTHTSTGAAGIINAHPNLEGEWNWTTELRKGYDINNLDEALAILEKVEGTSNYLKFDLANTRRQSIRNRALAVRKRFTDAYKAGDWDGLVETFYKVRWQMFFDAVLAAYDAGEPFVNLRGPRVPNGKTKEECERALKLDAEIWDFEYKWAHLK